MVVAIFKVIPKFGPFKPLSFEPLTPETERLFLESFERSLARYRGSLDTIRAGRRGSRHRPAAVARRQPAGG